MYFLPPFQEEEMVFLEEGLSVGVLPHRADGPVTDLWGVGGAVRASKQPAGLLGWGAGRWGQDLGTIEPHICAGPYASPLCLHPCPFP